MFKGPSLIEQPDWEPIKKDTFTDAFFQKSSNAQAFVPIMFTDDDGGFDDLDAGKKKKQPQKPQKTQQQKEEAAAQLLTKGKPSQFFAHKGEAQRKAMEKAAYAKPSKSNNPFT